MHIGNVTDVSEVRRVVYSRSADTFGSCANYKTLNKITSESRSLFLCVRSEGRVAMDDDDDDDEGNTRGKGSRRDGGEGEMPATRCRHVAEERDGACLFKPILYRIFILMDFFNSGPGRACSTFSFFGFGPENAQRPRHDLHSPMTILGLSYSR